LLIAAKAIRGWPTALSASRRSRRRRPVVEREGTAPRLLTTSHTTRRRVVATRASLLASLPNPENPWTPAISVMQGLQAALALYFQDGVDAAMTRHQLLSEAVKEGAKGAGLDLFGEGLADKLDRHRDPRARGRGCGHDQRSDCAATSAASSRPARAR